MDLREARALHDEVPVIDLHADTAKLMERIGFDISAPHERPLPGLINYVGHVDLPRMREGGVSGQFFGLWTVPYPQRGCAASVHAQLDALDRAMARIPDQLTWARTADEVRAAKQRGAIAALGGIEGGQALEGDLDRLAGFAAHGVRYLGLLHFSANQLGAPSKGVGADPDAPLTDFGRDAVREANRLGVLVDLAHVSRAGFFDALEVTRSPVVVSHTGVAGVNPHWRNIDDEQLRAMADNGGCVGVIFAKRFLGARGLDAVCDHILHIIDVAGEDLPALGSDYDGFVVPPDGLEDISQLPRLTAALSGRGLRPETLKKILGENVLRVLAEVPPHGDAGEPQA